MILLTPCISPGQAHSAHLALKVGLITKVLQKIRLRKYNCPSKIGANKKWYNKMLYSMPKHWSKRVANDLAKELFKRGFNQNWFNVELCNQTPPNKDGNVTFEAIFVEKCDQTQWG